MHRTEIAALARAFDAQAGICRRLGSSFYAELAARCARDVAVGGPLRRLFTAAGRSAAPLRDAVPLRLLGAVHALVLSGSVPELAAHYPSVGGVPRWPQAWRAFVDVVEARRDDLLRGLANRPQTNEVGRAAPLLGGFLRLAGCWRRPLRTFEIGASAGLLQNWARYRYRAGTWTWGDVGADVVLECDWRGPAPDLGAPVALAEQRGCDRAPVDVDEAGARQGLMAWVWPDQHERRARLQAALDLALRWPPVVDRADAADWVIEHVGPAPGRATVLFHAVVWSYLDAAAQRRIVEHLRRVGAAASSAAPLAWLRLEDPPAGPGAPHFELRLRTWPGDERLLAEVQPHGRWLRWHG